MTNLFYRTNDGRITYSYAEAQANAPYEVMTYERTDEEIFPHVETPQEKQERLRLIELRRARILANH